MIELLKSIILDFQEVKLETGVPRHINVEMIPKKATIFVGVRRSGKSTFLFQLIKQLLEKGVPQQNIVYLNFFDDRLHNLQQQGFDQIVEAYYSLYPEKKHTETVYYFFDEIQAVQGWEPFISRLLRTETCEVYLTGSSAQMLSREIATQMRGRALSWEIFPFSFTEFLDYQNIKIKEPLSTKNRLILQKAFDSFWQTGGFPEVLGLSPFLRIKVHQEYLRAILFRDLIERHDISHPKALTDLAHRIADNIASLYSINRLTGYLKSLGHKAPKYTVADFLEWFEDAYFFFTVRLFDASLARSNTNPKKIYCIDHALIPSVSSGILVNDGHLLENLVFMALRRTHEDIFYYKTKNGWEVDFITKTQSHSLWLVQVCESLADPQTKKREILALNEAMAELGLKTSTLVTRNEQERINLKSGKINVIPAWRFLLEISKSG